MKIFYTQARALSNKPNKIEIGEELREENHLLRSVNSVLIRSCLGQTLLRRGLKSYIIPRHKLGLSFSGHKYLKSQLAVAFLNFSKITCTFSDSG